MNFYFILSLCVVEQVFRSECNNSKRDTYGLKFPGPLQVPCKCPASAVPASPQQLLQASAQQVPSKCSASTLQVLSKCQQVPSKCLEVVVAGSSWFHVAKISMKPDPRIEQDRDRRPSAVRKAAPQKMIDGNANLFYFPKSGDTHDRP